MGKQVELDYDVAREMAASGAPLAEIARACGMTVSGFYARLKRDEELFAAVGQKRDGRKRTVIEPLVEPLPEPQCEAEEAADLARCVLLDEVEEAVDNGFNLTKAIACEIGEPIWKVVNALEDLVSEGRVQRVETATFAAFLPPGPVPPGRPVLNGEGGVTFVTGDEEGKAGPTWNESMETAFADESAAAYIRTRPLYSVHSAGLGAACPVSIGRRATDPASPMLGATSPSTP